MDNEETTQIPTISPLLSLFIHIVYVTIHLRHTQYTQHIKLDTYTNPHTYIGRDAYLNTHMPICVYVVTLCVCVNHCVSVVTVYDCMSQFHNTHDWVYKSYRGAFTYA